MTSKIMKLLDVCDFQGGTQPPKEEWIDSPKEGYIRMLQIRDYSQGDEKFIQYVKDNGKLHKCRCDDIMLSRYGYIGQAFSGLEGAYNVALVKVIKKIEINTRYLYHYFRSYYFQHFLLSNVGARATIPGFNKSELTNAIIPVPDIEEQKKIAELFDRLDTLHSTQTHELRLFDDLVKSQFIEMFGTFPANEKQWVVGKIRDVVSEVRYGTSRPATENGKYQYLRMNNITYGGELDLSDIKRIDIPEHEANKCTVRKGDVLFNRTNSKELVGKTCVYNRDEIMVLAGFIIRVRVNDKVLPTFLSAFLNASFSKKKLYSMCKAAIGQANINAQEMQNIGIYIPPIDLQNEFAYFVEQSDKSKDIDELEVAA